MIKRGFVLALLFVCGLCVTLEAKTNFMESELSKSIEKGDRVALLMVHFGTTHADTRAKTIGALNSLAHENYPDMELREAWTSRIIIRIMGKRGERVSTPLEALQQLKEDGFTHVVVQSSNVIEGIEMESLRRDIEAMRGEFKDIRVGNPLLYHTADYERVVKLLEAKRPKGGALVLVGHGTYTPATAQYAMVDYVLRDMGVENIHIGTIEGYPTYDSMLKQLRSSGVKRVTLMPFMFVCGEHAKNDIAGDWCDMLRGEGYDVDVLMEGLGEQDEVQRVFMDHVDFAMRNEMYDIMKKKSDYLQGK